MDIAKHKQQIEFDLKKYLNKYSPNHSFSEIYDYAVLPPGKAFRPLLCKAVEEDFSNTNSQNISYFSSSIEIHHSYTLVHDDLPCMDDDDTRRGKPSTHAKYGQWQALLAGDGLLNLSFGLLGNIEIKNLGKLIRFYNHCTGNKGLIHGQCLDLSEQMNESFDDLVETHKLKTARLIQLSLVGSYLIVKDEKVQMKIAKDLYRLGHAIGVNFQLLDDLTELVDEELTSHEQAVNPWLKRKKDCFVELKNLLVQTNEIFEKHSMPALKQVLEMYYTKIRKILTENQQTIQGHIQMDLGPIMSVL